MALIITKSEEDFNMFDWWKKAMIDNFVNFSGRARRKEFWYTALMNVLILFTLVFITHFTSDILDTDNYLSYEITDSLFSGIFIMLFIVFLIPYLAVSVRRLHDTGRSGWYICVSLVPIIGRFILLVFYLEDSKPTRNKWGKSPKHYKNSHLIDEIGKNEDE